MTAYASIDDLGSEWENQSGDALQDLNRGLEEASTIVDITLRNAGMDPEEVDKGVLRIVVCRMVRRAFPVDAGIPVGVESIQASLGSHQQTFRWGGGRSGELIVYRNEMPLLGITPRVFNLDLLPEGYAL